ncbi:MAG: radical SAM protein [Planctomycetaceae bacterium]|jgi:wyosine [tRNA(Phe)-imidazoG37] synthetase (radical SAM superfamily)
MSFQQDPEPVRIPGAPAETAAESASVFQRHGRYFEDNRFVYPVVSRRSRGLSIGINLNPDKICNFDCIYCQVNRRTEAETRFVEIDQLLDELRKVLQLAVSGEIYSSPRFQQTPLHLRRLNDLAFSGDGEPTTFVNFDEILERTAELRTTLAPADTKMVLITNASMFHREHVRRGLRTLDRNNGQIWAKLDAGTEEYYKLIERTTIPFQRILDNIANAARERPLVIQSLFMNVDRVPPTDTEISAFCDRLNEVQSSGGKIEFVQIYTVARPPAESFVSALTEDQLNDIAKMVRTRCSLTALVFP